MLTSKIDHQAVTVDYERLFKDQSVCSEGLRIEAVSVREQRLKKMEVWLSANKEQLATALEDDLGKSYQESYVSEIIPLLTELRHTRTNLKKWSSPKKLPTSWAYLGTRAQVFYEPKGVCLVISPWNYPLLLSLGPVISALAAGNTVVLKPSEFAPATADLLRRMIEELYEPSLCTVCTGDVEVSTQLLALPFNHIFFTGSPRVGKIVMSKAANYLSGVTLELGGKSPTIVDETADLKQAAKKIAWGKWLNAGQTCLAPDYLFVHKSVSDEFLTCLREALVLLYPDPEATAKIVNERHFERLVSMLDEDDNMLVSGKQNKSKLRFPPTLVVNPTENSPLLSEEIFGPILPVLYYEDLQGVIRTINEKPKPLSVYLFTRSKSIQKVVRMQTSSGSLVINDCVLQFAHPELPFGGINNSGIGRSHGFAGFETFSNQKSILKQRSGWSTSQIVYPPYDRLKKTLINLLMKYI